jgi:DNA-binding CsgD family transcriptional regulator
MNDTSVTEFPRIRRANDFVRWVEANTSTPLFAKRRTPEIVKARRLVMWVLRSWGLSLMEIARILTVDHSTIVHHLKHIKPDEISYAGAYARMYADQKADRAHILREAAARGVGLEGLA